MVTLTELCQECKNWFVREKRTGTFRVEGGQLAAPFLQDGQYYRIIGSVFSDGVHKHNDEHDLLSHDEVFTGEVWSLGLPAAFIKLADDIDAWRAKNEGVNSLNMSPFQSESFSGYSYTKAGSQRQSSNGSTSQTWQNMFSKRINMWRKIR